MEKKWEKNGKKRWHRERKVVRKNPVGTLPLELEEGGPIDEFNPLEKQSNSMCSRDRHDIQHFY